uniref:Ig-like domain-containing protein n=1 Tax=Kryptolebias marmoratus TaxID=37003 RepID=A0A3Q3ALN0_KRYMA
MSDRQLIVTTLMHFLPEDKAINGTHYQSVSCSADGGRPTPQISWLVGGRPPSDDPFTVNVSKTLHSNGTSTLSSVLRFPTRLQDEDSVTCVHCNFLRLLILTPLHIHTDRS